MKKIALFVHEAQNGIGHTNAMLEVLRRFPLSKGDQLDFVCYTHDQPEELVQIEGVKVNIHKVPFPWLKPFLLKMIWFHLYSWFLTLTKYNDFTRISIGIASFNCDYINVQFVHQMWEKYYFQNQKMPFYKYLYKKILFLYFRISEQLYYRKRNVCLICLSSFIKDYLEKEYEKTKDKCILCYSGTNIRDYFPIDQSKSDIFKELIGKYPQLEALNLEKPIYLFVGAFERKGLKYAIESLAQLKTSQLIIIGKPEVGNPSPEIPENINAVWISFTKKLNLFYNLADNFVFPTLYEPFGLVIVEAAACGMRVFITKEEVGASEIFKNLKDIHFVEKMKRFPITNNELLDKESRSQNVEQRINVINKYSWDMAAKTWYQAIF